MIRGGRGCSRCWPASFTTPVSRRGAGQLATEAIEIARAAGDPAALAHTLANAIWAIWVPDTLQERQRLSDELVELAQRLDDPRLSFWAAAGA